MKFIVYSNTFLQQKNPHEIFLTLIYGNFLLPKYCPFEPNFDRKFCTFFKGSLNFRAHALQLDLKKV